MIVLVFRTGWPLAKLGKSTCFGFFFVGNMKDESCARSSMLPCVTLISPIASAFLHSSRFAVAVTVRVPLPSSASNPSIGQLTGT